MRTYAMSDLHGEYDKFIQMLNLIEFNNQDRLFILGDVVDRGSNPIILLQYIMNKNNMTLLLGNHEDMMLKSLISKDLRLWFKNGGEVTYNQFMNLNTEEQNKIYNYLENLQTKIIIDDYWFLSHSGIDPNKNFELQDKDDYIWTREKFYKNKGIEGYFYIFGHTPTKLLHNKFEIWHDKIYRDKLCIDCGVTYGGKLACIEITTRDELNVFYC